MLNTSLIFFFSLSYFLKNKKIKRYYIEGFISGYANNSPPWRSWVPEPLSQSNNVFSASSALPRLPLASTPQAFWGAADRDDENGIFKIFKWSSGLVYYISPGQAVVMC